MILSVSSNSSPTIAQDAVVKTAASVTTPASAVYDSERLSATGATTWNEFVLSPDSLDQAVTYESATPSVCTVAANGAVTRVASGMGVVMASNSRPSRRKVVLDMRDVGGQTAVKFSEYTADSLSDLCAAEVQTLLAAGGDTNYFSTINHAASTYTRNAGCWLASINLAAISVANRDVGGAWQHQRAGVAITTRHVVFAAHYAPPVGAELRFANASGTVYAHTVQAYHGAVSAGEDVLSDLKVAVITPALNASITPMKVAGPWIMQDITPSGTGHSYYMGGLAVWLDQTKNGYTTHIGNVTATVQSPSMTGTFSGVEYTDIITEGFRDSSLSSAYLDDYQEFVKIPITGDSGSPVMLVIGGEPVLLWTWFTSLMGTPVYASTALLSARIAAAGTAAGISTGYTVQVAPDPTL